MGGGSRRSRRRSRGFVLMLAVVLLTATVPIDAKSLSASGSRILTADASDVQVHQQTATSSAGPPQNTNWTQQSLSTSPPGRDGSSIAYDAANRTDLLFGGYEPCSLCNNLVADTWAWNGQTWSQQNPATSPSAREDAGMAYYDPTQSVILFGGDIANNCPPPNDTWSWNGSTWSQLAGGGPEPKQWFGMDYDAATKSIVLFGGNSGPCDIGGVGPENDTWIFNGSWSRAAPGSSPSPRDSFAMAYDPATGLIVLFGGEIWSTSCSCHVYVNETWTWDGSTWTQQQPANSPSARVDSRIAYDSASGTLILFGGSSGSSSSLTETWSWDGANWTQLSPANAPTSRQGSTMAAHAQSGTDVLFGGVNQTCTTSHGKTTCTNNYLSDTWTWDGGPAGREFLGCSNPTEHATTSATQAVDTASGNYCPSYTDMSIPGRGIPLAFTRTYNSAASGQNGPLGFGWTHNYNMSLSFDPGGDATVHQEDGSTLPFIVTTLGYQAPTRAMGTLIKNTTDGTFMLTRKDLSQYQFTAAGQLIKELDRNDVPTMLTYNASGQLATVTDPAQRSLSLNYTGNFLTSVGDSTGRTVFFQPDGSGNLQTVTNVNTGPTTYGYDTNHLLTSVTDPRRNPPLQVSYYAGTAQVNTTTDALNRTTTYSYTSNTTTVTDPKGNVTVEQYQNNELVSRTLGSGTPQAATWTFAYDPTAGISSLTDPNKHTWTSTWDGNGNLLKRTDPLQHPTSYTYDANGNLTTITDPMTYVTTLGYDAANVNLISVARLNTTTNQYSTTSLTRDPAHPGDVINEQDPDGNSWSFSYDANGYPQSVTDRAGDVTTYTYDNLGNLRTKVSPKGNVSGGTPSAFTTSYGYSPSGQLKSVQDPLGDLTQYQYDADGNLQILTDANGHATTYTYDVANQLQSVARPDSSSIQYGYDLAGNLSQWTDARGNATTVLGYDPLNRIASITDPLGRKTSYGHDGASNLTTLSDPMARTTSYGYDNTNELTSISYSDGKTPKVSVIYDADGQRQSMSDGSGTTTYSFNSLHQLTKSVNGASQEVDYGYDLVGNLTSIKYPGQTSALLRTYDTVNRLASVKDWLGHQTTLTYDADSNLQTELYANGVTGTLGYDNVDRPTSIVYTAPGGTQLLNLGYGRYGMGQVKSENSVGYGYDTLERLVSGGTTTFSEDPANDLTQIAPAGGVTSTLAYDAANQLSTLTRSNNTSLTFSYDSDGNRVQSKTQSGTTTSYTYDEANRLTGYAGSTTYAYNGDGLRMSKTASRKTTAFAWDTAESLPLQLTDATTNYVYGPGGVPLEQVTSSGSVQYFLVDQLGSTRALSNSSAVVDQSYSYDPYGNVTSSSGSIVNPLQYAGQYQDAESGLIYLRARYFDPSTGGFIARDPAIVRTQQPYAYVRNDPLDGKDPTGLCDWNPFSSQSCEGVIARGLSELPGAVAADAQQGQQNFVKNFQQGGWIAIGVPLAGAAGIAAVGIAAEAGVGALANSLAARILALNINPATLGITATVAANIASRPFVQSTLVRMEIMAADNPRLDPEGVLGAVRWDVPGAFNGTQGTWELVVNAFTNTILHFNFTS